jgi:hypothetical protein
LETGDWEDEEDEGDGENTKYTTCHLLPVIYSLFPKNVKNVGFYLSD